MRIISVVKIFSSAGDVEALDGAPDGIDEMAGVNSNGWTCESRNGRCDRMDHVESWDLIRWHSYS